MFLPRLFARVSAAALLTVLAVAPTKTSWCAHRDGELLVKYKAGLRSQVAAAAAAHGASVTRTIDQINVHQLKLPPGLSVEEAAKRFKNDPRIEYVGPNHIIRICRHPNDDIYQNGLLWAFTQWGLYDYEIPDSGIDAPQAWDITTGSTDIVIAVVDTGIYANHEDLYAKVIRGRNTIAGDNPLDTDDDNGHGTFVGGVAGAMTNNSTGIAGVSWGARLMPVKVIGASGEGAEADAADGIIWAADNGAHVLNMSFGTTFDPGDVLRAACEYAWNKGCVLVAASGNEDSGDPFFPASYDVCLATGASNEEMQRCTAADWGSGGSNYGPYLDVVAPGSNIVSATIPDQGLWGDYTVSAGTSAAAPFVSGTAALLLSIHPTWTNAQIVDQIKTSAKDTADPGWDQYTGWGVVSAYRALTWTPLAGRTIGELNALPGGTLVKVTNAVVTSDSLDMPDRLYVEQMDRACGTLLPFTVRPAGYAEGDVVDITGTVMTVNGERAITGATLTKKERITPLKPIAVATRWVGGGRKDRKSGVTNGQGTNNVGLLVSTFGRVTAVGWTYFYIDDGSGREDGSGMTGLKVVCRNLAKPHRGNYVRVTGISSVEQPTDAGVSIPVVRVRRQSDIAIVW